MFNFILYPEPRTQNPEPRTQNPEPRTQNPEPRTKQHPLMKMQEIINGLPKQAKDKHIENKKFFTSLKKRTPKHLDVLMQELHDAEFKKTDCLQCANCCKTTGPLFTDKDVKRIAKHFRIKEQQFIETYLKIDEDNDYVLKTVPCAFLGADNYCSIYDIRPKACSEFPHTDRRKFQQITDLTLKNVAVCPAAFNIVEEMKLRLQNKSKSL